MINEIVALGARAIYVPFTKRMAISGGSPPYTQAFLDQTMCLVKRFDQSTKRTYHHCPYHETVIIWEEDA